MITQSNSADVTPVPTARKVVGIMAFSYLCLVAAVWGLLHFAADFWWFATVLLYSPRWLFALPLLLLGPLALWKNRWALVSLLAAAVILVFPVLGLRISWPQATAAGLPELRVLTCNMQGGEAAHLGLAELIRREEPDIVALQEWSGKEPLHLPPDWHVQKEGQLLIASRFPLADVSRSVRLHPQSRWPPVNALYCVVETPCGKLGFCCVHLLTPRAGIDKVLDQQTVVAPGRSWALREQTDFRRWESEELKLWVEGFKGPVVVAGDFNMPVDSTIYRSNWASFSNAFSSAGLGFGHTKVTKKNGFTYGARIDHILVDSRLFHCRKCWVGPDIGSDHLPLLADVVALSPGAR